MGFNSGFKGLTTKLLFGTSLAIF